MKPIQISETIQEFDGEKYYLCGMYFQHKGKRLHREVWKRQHGEIPSGNHIHHKDGNRANNNIANLECVTASEHESQHNSDIKLRPMKMKAIKMAQDAARAWHGTDEGKEWHSKHSKESWVNRKPQTYECSHCGKEYQTIYVYPKESNHFCSNNCKSAFRRKRLKKVSI